MVSPLTRTRSALPATAHGTSVHAYTLEDWGVLALIALIWGSSFLFMEIGLRAFAPGVVTLARIGLGTATLALLARARTPVDREDWGRIALLGTVWMAIPLTLFPIAQQWIDSSVAGMINGAMPIFAAAWSAYLLRRLPGWRQMLGIGIGFLGIILVFLPELQASADTALGALVALFAVTFYGLATNLAVPLQQKYGAAPVVLRAQMVALLLVLPFGLWQLGESTWTWESALAMIPLGVLGTGLAIVLMATLAGRVGAPRASIAIYFLPLVAVVLGVVVLGESVAPMALVGVALVLVGAWIASRRER
ncbi:MAG TPA: DMT family transporter [Candidatus Deferrimicrobium sp.]|nr:DMT family transporter [Candidatus Deferrimicrobium sp.]